MPEADAPHALLITRNFPPLVGGMERLNAHLLAELSTAWRPLLCGPAGSRAFVADGTPVRESGIRPLPWFLLRSLLSALVFAFRHRPQFVIGGSGLVAPLTWFAARVSRARAVLYLHGLDLIAPSRVYQLLWLPFIRAADLAFVNSANTRRLAMIAGIRPERIVVLHPGTHVPPLGGKTREEARGLLGWGERPVLLSVGRLTRRKGLAEFVEHALPQIVAERADALLAIIGEEATNALNASGAGERERILAAAERAGVASHVMFLGRRSEDELDAAYLGADCHVFPVLEFPGDVEGFGMVALEAAAHGLSTVAFSVGGVPDAVDDGETGRLVAPGDYRAFARETLAILDRNNDPGMRDSCRRFARGKSWDEFGRRLREALAVAG